MSERLEEMNSLANAITDYYCKKNIITEDKKEIYCYGFMLIIADIINYTIILALGIVFSKILDSVAFLITLCTIRQFSGGFHAKTFAICRLSFIVTYISILLISYFLSNICVWGIALINTSCLIFIFCFAPIEHPNKPMTPLQKKQNQLKSIITSVIVSVVSIIFVAMDMTIGVTISITLFAVVFWMLIGLIMRKERKENVSLDQ